jgi:phosphatidyl-myo-inositol alpha-mannosyltransferase
VRIGIVCPYSFDVPGGVQNHIRDLAETLIRRGPISAARVRRWLSAGRFDVLHVHEPINPSLSMLAVLAARGPVVATFHTALTRSRAIFAAQGMLQLVLEKITARIAVSDSARRVQVEHLAGGAWEIPNGVAVARYATAQPRSPGSSRIGPACGCWSPARAARTIRNCRRRCVPGSPCWVG